MKYFFPNFDQKIPEQPISINMFHSPIDNNNAISELLNIIMNNPSISNNLTPLVS